ncbi:glucosamine-6-phosphate deaminase [Aequorivita sp. H23M31]|uniref:Glucosamine-6-phosphate deaminase n=1 Tax=Aequorivita ciconiae TaxID=2494375 RepID=A0A410G1S3_9FLAO|nr:glucosamine-6-phosphate deaminase [Aequorivita sp. H23M31]QAA81228.1 glucosamine-6-phosphate deaminase [Aequorivita sp. H23M31]
MPISLNTRSRIKSLTLCADAEQASVYAAHKIADIIKDRQNAGKQAVLGLATGITPISIYKELVRLHKNESLSFQNVITFNLDEYYPICPNNDQSYTYFMHNYLFGQIDIAPQNIHIPHTDCSLEEVDDYCKDYEAKIRSYGGLDLQLLGIGRNGHIGFNEPGSRFDSITRLVELHELTRRDAETSFGSLDNVPRQAISVGIDTICQAKKILLVALGARKSEIIHKALNTSISEDLPASFLQNFPQVEYVLDSDAAALIEK